mgnify:CR=1 FL=1
MKYKRIFTIVVDSFGIGHAPDAKEFDDEGAHTFGHILEKMPDLKIPNMMKIGLGNIGIQKETQTMGYALRLQEASAGKDTMTGHWEMMGLHITTPFQTFTETGFPKELLDELSKRCDGRKIIGNKAASGTEILDELAEQEINDGDLIVYTSADSVLQICGNEETMGVDTLYRYCEAARELTMKPEWKVGRVIARPYTGKKKGEFHPLDLVSSFLPAGTLSGAPKIRAMEIIDELESVRRGLYGGATGYIDFSGDMDFCITIRTMIKKKNRVYLQAGAGIVADSVPENEYQECCNKVMALAKTLIEEENL